MILKHILKTAFDTLQNGSVDSDRNDPDRISEVGLRSKEISEVGFRSKYLLQAWDRKELDRKLFSEKY